MPCRKPVLNPWGQAVWQGATHSVLGEPAACGVCTVVLLGSPQPRVPMQVRYSGGLESEAGMPASGMQ